MPPLTEPRADSAYFTTHLQVQRPAHTRITRNKYIGGNIRQAIEKVFGALGGWEGMVAWAKDNPDLFYGSVVTKLLPAELAESGHGQPIRVLVYAPNGTALTEKPVELASSAALPPVVGDELP